MWGAYRMLAPELSIPTEYAYLRPQQVYPATTPTTKKLGPRDLMAVHRTFYEVCTRTRATTRSLSQVDTPVLTTTGP